MANSEITLDELHKHLKSLGKDEVFLDVRTPLEFAEGHIPGSINISYEDVDENLEALKKYKQIFIYCRAGRRAEVAFETLKKAGFDNLVCVLDAGTEAWKERGYPIEE